MIQLGYFCANNPQPSETFIYDLLKALSEGDRFDVTFVSGTSNPLEIDFEIKSCSTGFHDRFSRSSYRLHKLFFLKGNNAEYKRMRFNQWKAIRQLKKSNLPKFDIAFVEYATTGILAMEYFQKMNIPFLVHVHGYDITKSLNDKGYAKQIIRLFNSSSGFIAASNYMRRRLILLGCDESKIHMVRLGVEHSNISAISWAERKIKQPSIIFLGRLTEKKNPIALLYAFSIVLKKLPFVTLTIIGDGPLYKEVTEVIASLGLTNSVKLYGKLNRNESFPILNSHWVYTQHSVTSISGDTEGFAISLAEAALHELPVVSTIHNGITENVIDGVTGYLVPEYDYETMAEKIIYLIQNPDIAEQMGKSGREHIMKLCEPGERIEKISDLLKEVAIKKL